MNINTNNLPRVPIASLVVLAGALIVGGSVDLSRVVGAGGAWTILACGSAWTLWLARPHLPRQSLKVLLPLLLFTMQGVGSMLWFPPSIKGLQLLSVTAGFFGFLLLAARETERDPSLADFLGKAWDWAAFVAAFLYGLLLLKERTLEANGFIAARPWALFVVVAVAVQLAKWQSGNIRGLIFAGVLTLLVFASLSRTALVAIILLFPLAAVSRGNIKSFFKAGAVLAIGAATFVVAVFTNEKLHQRFFGYDASMSVGGVSVNASGRTQMWQTLLDDISKSGTQLFGKGVASSTFLIEKYFPELGHPHNDYLRFYYDYGLLGLACWVAFMLLVAVSMFTSMNRANRAQRFGLPQANDFRHHLGALLGLGGIAFTMATDNSVSYSWVMFPLGILVGTSIGLSRNREMQSAKCKVQDEEMRFDINRPVPRSAF